ncbi:flagellar motor switch protein FliN [Bacillus sp. EB106-08-02-XG196]|jgi:flagellar motor switch protein FliN|nr:flagellar motor switch protein FliN [Bacillus sp. EB106-08-02-XG196]
MIEKGKLTQDEMDALLGNSQQSIINEPFQFTELEQDDFGQSLNEKMNLDLLLDIPLEIVVELGRTKKKISEVLELTSGSIVELDKMAGEPVDVYVNSKLIAKGEVVVIEEHFGVRIKEICQSPL